MGKLATAIETKAKTAKGPKCNVAVVRSLLGKGDAADLEAALASPLVPGAAIAAGLREIGHQIGDSSVTRHRRGLCGCAR